MTPSPRRTTFRLPAADDYALSADAAAGLKNLQQLVQQLRWIAVIGQIATLEAAHYALGLSLPYDELLISVACLVLFNVVSLLRLRLPPEVRHPEVFVALLVDVGVLTVQLYLSGGITNPFVFLYLLQVTLGAVLLRGAYIWSMVIITALCFGLLARHHLPLPLVHEPQGGFSSLYAFGLLVCFLLTRRAGERLHHAHPAQPARARRPPRRGAPPPPAEEEHIVRMGLLASGAAHELGTPLSTLAVILGDWIHDQRLSADPLLMEDIQEMLEPGTALQEHRQRHPAVVPARRAARSRPRPRCGPLSMRWRRTGAPRVRSRPSFCDKRLRRRRAHGVGHHTAADGVQCAGQCTRSVAGLGPDGGHP